MSTSESSNSMNFNSSSIAYSNNSISTVSYRSMNLDGDVPLAVNSSSIRDNAGQRYETIEKQKAPKATLQARVWWSWIPILGSILSIKETHDRRRKEKKEEREAKKAEKAEQKDDQ